MSFGGRGRGGFHQNNYNGGRNNGASPGPDSNAVQVEILGWNGAVPAECISFIQRKCKVTVTNYSVDTVSGVLRGYVRSDSDANTLLNYAGVRFAGNALKFSKGAVAAGAGGGMQQPAGVGNTDTKQLLETFVRSRYNADIKLLNLSAVHQDHTLNSRGFFNNLSTTSKFFPALMKIAGGLKLDVVSADLSNNNLSDLSNISTLAHTFPTLKNLSLQHNKIARVRALEVWKKDLNFVRELLLQGNPLLNTSNPSDVIAIKTDIMKVFPRLVVLNGEVVRNEQALAQMLTFPFVPQPMFFSDADVQGISTNFISNFVKLWDEDRPGLMVLYQNVSQFSLQVDSASPHATNPKGPPDFAYYLPSSRNLTRVSSAKARTSKLAVGQEQIFKVFSQIPKTRHDLMAKPENYSMEAFKIASLGAISISLHGNFEEVAPPQDQSHVTPASSGRGKYHSKKPKVALGWKSFDRSIVVIPGPNSSMIVASDLLCVRTEADAEAFRPSPTAQGAAAAANGSVPGAVPSSTPSPAPQPGIAPAGVPPVGPSVADLPQELKTSLNQQQQELLVKVLLETKLNIQYGFMLCQQSAWDYSQCIVNFKNSAASLPPDAFVA